MTFSEYDVVAITEDILTSHEQTCAPILLKKGQVGTVLMIFDDEACLIDFSDEEGQTYAMETVSLAKLMPLFHSPVLAAA
mgnify:CR=1 FL=1